MEGILTRISSHIFKLKKIKHYQATVEIYTAGAYTGRGSDIYGCQGGFQAQAGATPLPLENNF